MEAVLARVFPIPVVLNDSTPATKSWRALIFPLALWTWTLPFSSRATPEDGGADCASTEADASEGTAGLDLGGQCRQ